MQIFYQPLLPQHHFFLDAEESRHCVKVLRKKEGDRIMVVDGLGTFYHVRIQQADPRQCTFTVVESTKVNNKHFSIHIAIAPTKNADRLEWFVEKAVELGIDDISLIISENTERKKLKTDRLERKAVSAMKQSIKATLPRIHTPVPFQSFVQQHSADLQKYLAYVSDTPIPHLMQAASPSGAYLVLIGPEGDFTPEEVQQVQEIGFQTVSLGPYRLRTETAGLAACHILNLLNENVL